MFKYLIIMLTSVLVTGIFFLIISEAPYVYDNDLILMYIINVLFTIVIAIMGMIDAFKLKRRK